MLVLSRKPNESILINGDIRVSVVSINGGQVKLGFTAPEDVSIFRSELVETKPSDAPGANRSRRGRVRTKQTAWNGRLIG